MYRFLCIILAFISALAVSASLVVAASAQNPTASLTQAAKLLEQGQAELSIQLINRTLKTGNVPSKLAAKGIMLRAQAQEKLGKHAFALADYNSALWMQDLSENDRHFAEQGRRRIMANLGVNRRNTQTASAQPVAKPKVWGAEVRTTETEKRTKGIGSIFSNLLGLSSEEKEEPKTPPASETVYSVGTTETAALISPSSESQVVAGSSGNLVASNDQQAQAIDDTVVAQREFTGDFAIQFSAVRSEDTALYEADRVGRRYGEWLNGRTPSIKIRGTQDGGTLYKIIAQPYERGEGLATCEFLKTKGVQCMLISR